MLDVTTAPSTRDLTTLEAVKEELGICADEGASDPRIGRMISRASAMIESRLGRPLARATVAETLAANVRRRQWLTYSPVVAVTSVKADGQLIEATSYQVDRGAGCVYRFGGWEPGQLFNAGASGVLSEERGEEIYEFVYQGGYYLPGWTTASDGAITAADWRLPADLQGAAIELVRVLWYQAARNPHAKSESLGDYSVSYGNADASSGSAKLPQQVEVMLKPYLRIHVA